MKRTYDANEAWRDIAAFLPKTYRFDDDYKPVEDHWEWRGSVVHLDRFPNPEATHRVVLLHGVGTNGRMLSTIAGGPLWRRGYETVSMDLLNYGETHVRPGARVVYQDWVDQVVDFIDAELARDPRPIVLYGLSAGGMLAYHAAAISRKVAGIVGMCFLDQRDPATRRTTAKYGFADPVAMALLPIAGALIGGVKIPMSSLAKMNALVNDRAALRTCLRDGTSAGAWVTLRFLASYMQPRPAVELEDFDVCPVLLTQPEDDTWTPLSLSRSVLDRLKKVETGAALLKNAGHYPIEEPGLTQMNDAIDAFITNLRAPAPAATPTPPAASAAG